MAPEPIASLLPAQATTNGEYPPDTPGAAQQTTPGEPEQVTAGEGPDQITTGAPHHITPNPAESEDAQARTPALSKMQETISTINKG